MICKEINPAMITLSIFDKPQLKSVLKMFAASAEMWTLLVIAHTPIRELIICPILSVFSVAMS